MDYTIEIKGLREDQFDNIVRRLTVEGHYSTNKSIRSLEFRPKTRTIYVSINGNDPDAENIFRAIAYNIFSEFNEEA
jgi:hypothetical protein